MSFEPEMSSFWGIIVPPGNSLKVDPPSQSTVTITNATIPDVTDQTPEKICRLMATFQTLLPDDEEEEEKNEKETETAKYKETEILICQLTPKIRENQSLNFTFSPLNIIEFHNKGHLDIHLSGYVLPIEPDEFEIGDEDGEDMETPALSKVQIKDEQKNEEADEIQNRISKMAAKSNGRQPPAQGTK